jgi:hypothetical protein
MIWKGQKVECGQCSFVMFVSCTRALKVPSLAGSLFLDFVAALAVGICCGDHATHSTRKSWRITSPTGGGHLISIVRLKTKATEFSFSCCFSLCLSFFCKSWGVIIFALFNCYRQVATLIHNHQLGRLIALPCRKAVISPLMCWVFQWSLICDWARKTVFSDSHVIYWVR